MVSHILQTASWQPGRSSFSMISSGVSMREAVLLIYLFLVHLPCYLFVRFHSDIGGFADKTWDKGRRETVL